MKTNFTLIVVFLFGIITTTSAQITQTCYTENFNSPTTAGWSYSQGASEGDYDRPNNACVEDRGIITPGVGGNNPANIFSPEITSVGPVQIQLKFDFFNLNSNLRCDTWKDFECPTSIDVFYWIGATKYAGVIDLILPTNGPAGQSTVTVSFIPPTPIPVGTNFKIEMAFKPKSGVGNCVQGGTKNVIDDISICQVTCTNCVIDAKNDILCTDAGLFTNVVNGNVSLNDTKYTGADIVYSLANGPFANGSSTVGGATLVINSDGTFTLTRTDLTKVIFDFTYKMYDQITGLTDFASGTLTFGCGGPLPVSLSKFNTSRINSNVNLNWQTVSETNVIGFEVQKKVGAEFKTIGFVQASNNINGASYTFQDINSSTAITEYRLKIIDQNYAARFSEIRTVNGVRTSGDFAVYPNPSNGASKIFISDVTASSNVRVIDNSGRIVKQFNSTTNSLLELNGLQKGVYLIRITNIDGTNNTKKLIINN